MSQYGGKYSGEGYTDSQKETHDLIKSLHEGGLGYRRIAHHLFFERLKDFGFYDCCKKFNSERVRTLRHKHSDFHWQNDYLFAGKKLYDACTSSKVIDDPSLYEISDHNPIIAEFDLSLVKQ